MAQALRGGYTGPKASAVRRYNATGELIATEPAYRLYSTQDRRYRRGLANHLEGNWNTQGDYQPARSTT